eukprot:CAMPEP_0205912188 /NCGR_PEP_ID=MMETSP1325-20131115/5663_1 /ASSEMBLY_ACC=CAM_ASM_000708 /TAXON_ID=236786 /ORGANISM="Florenciella sp., Strain RCC1007" /LENGTH=266 /DNA_ID=CAMNT_0053278839 /DNA_START=60 /DNA_END=860 /DNA_ORIENTATION=+
MRRSLGLSDTAPFAVHLIASPIAVAVVGVSPSRNATVCSFRGTKDAVDVLTDIKFLSKTFEPRAPLHPHTSNPHADDAKVHGGFLAAWLSIADEVCRVVDGARSRHVLMTGHSMGGAVAQLASAYLLGSLPETTSTHLVTVGAPAIGNVGFKRILESAAVPRGGLRFTGHGDVVPRVGGVLAYEHAGAEVRMEISDSSVAFFKRLNARGLVPGFSAIAPHVLYKIGGLVYAFWLFQGAAAASKAEEGEPSPRPPLALGGFGDTPAS